MQTSIVLTVAQGKRLIAKAVAQLPEVKHALSDGILAIGRGTTNGYVAEEILGESIAKGEYVAGRTLPPGTSPGRLGSGKYPDIALKAGERMEGVSIHEAVEQMRPGDVFIKGGNALNYRDKVVGVLIGHPMGGTCGDNYGAIISRKVHLIIPIGLEKLVSDDIAELSLVSRCPDVYQEAPVFSLFPITGTIITEIEAMAILFGVNARLLASGGVAGAEGAIWLLLDGCKDQLDDAMEFIRSIQHEPNMRLLDE